MFSQRGKPSSFFLKDTPVRHFFKAVRLKSSDVFPQRGLHQWPFQVPKMVPTIYVYIYMYMYIRSTFQAYVREDPHKIWPEKWY